MDHAHGMDAGSRPIRILNIYNTAGTHTADSGQLYEGLLLEGARRADLRHAACRPCSDTTRPC